MQNSTSSTRVLHAGADRLEAVIDAAGRAASWVVLVHVVLVASNVILRYLFQVGPVSLQELEWHLMSPIALVGMAYALRHDDHVRVDLFYDRYRPRFKALVDLLSAGVTVLICVAVIKLSAGFVLQSWTEGEISPDPGGLPYRWLLKAFIPLGFVLLAIQATAIALRRWALLRKVA